MSRSCIGWQIVSIVAIVIDDVIHNIPWVLYISIVTPLVAILLKCWIISLELNIFHQRSVECINVKAFNYIYISYVFSCKLKFKNNFAVNILDIVLLTYGLTFVHFYTFICKMTFFMGKYKFNILLCLTHGSLGNIFF